MTSENVKKNKHFLKLLMQTDIKQGRNILSFITDNQLSALSEICYNLLRFKHNKELQRKVNYNKRFLARVSNIKTGRKEKKNIVRRKSKQLIEILKKVSHKLAPLLD